MQDEEDSQRLQWYPEVLHFCPTTPMILLGLKSDLRHKRTCIELLKTQGLTPVTPQQGEAVAKKMGAAYMECSSKEMNGVHEIFDTAVSITVGASGGSGGGEGGHSMMPTVSTKPKKRSCKIL